MQGISNRKLWAAMLAVGALGLLAVVAFTGRATAAHHGHSNKAGKAEVKMVATAHDLLFRGDATVKHGKKLKIVNKTSPKQAGPHTFTLVKKSDLPTTHKQIKKCENFELKVCAKGAAAHHVGPPPDFPVGKPVVDVGKKGWDRSLSKKAKGDSWFTQERGATESRKVKARPGKTLYFFCLVHPFMQGKIKVVK